MFNVTNEITINCSRFDVAEFSANPDMFAQWYNGISKVEWKTNRPLIVGSQIALKTNLLGSSSNHTFEVTEYVPGFHLILSESKPALSLQIMQSWEENADGHTILTMQYSGALTALPKFLTRTAEAILGGSFLRSSIRNLANLKKVLERKECKVN